MMGVERVARMPRTVAIRGGAVVQDVVRAVGYDRLRLLQAKAQPERAGPADCDWPPPRPDPLLQRQHRGAIAFKPGIGPRQRVQPLRVEADGIRERLARWVQTVHSRPVTS